MAISWTDVSRIAPELVSLTVETQNAILEDVDLEIDAGRWGSFADKGRKYLAAHLGTVASRGSVGVAGAVTSETLGPMSRSYDSSSSSDAGLLSSTRYGIEYVRIRRIACGPGAFVP